MVFFTLGFLNASNFIVDVMERATSFVSILNQVTCFVVSVAAVNYGTTKVV
ncbi:hypothetical protein [Neisseria sicca]|uniref:Flagellar motor protein n=1 Tax=Neisseria macacae ATCC 33926 TaxID=997348 RepID=A0AA36UFN0_9NEIS|nr:hypothetical protein [Neisseria sicca]EGQ73533.1 flagellar motor protein [Neisseria macacae ATCC 33926]